MSRVDDALVADAVVALLRTELDPVQIGDGRAPTVANGDERVIGPEGVTARSFGVVYKIAGGRFEGDGYLGQPESIEVVRFQIVGVGVQRTAADRLASRMCSILVDRLDAPPASYVFPLTVPGHTVIDRHAVGKIPQDNGGGLVQMGHIVDVRVCVA